MNDEKQFISVKEARKILGVTSNTLRAWAEKGKITAVTTPSGNNIYDKQSIFNAIGISNPIQEKRKIAYCRVSSLKQKEDLARQKSFFRSNFPSFEIIADIGSGINWKRKGLLSILESAMQGNISEIMVAHRDRLCRFAFDLFKFIFESNKVKLTVLNEEKSESESTELADDIISIIHVYSCRSMGKRRYKNKENKDISKHTTEKDIETVDGDEEVCME